MRINMNNLVNIELVDTIFPALPDIFLLRWTSRYNELLDKPSENICHLSSLALRETQENFDSGICKGYMAWLEREALRRKESLARKTSCLDFVSRDSFEARPRTPRESQSRRCFSSSLHFSCSSSSSKSASVRSEQKER